MCVIIRLKFNIFNLWEVIYLSMDYSKLRGRIIEKYQTQGNFANEINLSERSLSLKLNGMIDWKQTEIVKAVDLLGIPMQEIDQYFFKTKVQNV